MATPCFEEDGFKLNADIPRLPVMEGDNLKRFDGVLVEQLEAHLTDSGVVLALANDAEDIFTLLVRQTNAFGYCLGCGIVKGPLGGTYMLCFCCWNVLNVARKQGVLKMRRDALLEVCKCCDSECCVPNGPTVFVSPFH